MKMIVDVPGGVIYNSCMHTLEEVVHWLDDLFSFWKAPIPDASLNGLQVENSGRVGVVGLAVDPTLKVIEEAARTGVHLLVVHHGLYWKGQAVLPRRDLYLRLRALMRSDIALYAVHLPLDAHPEIGHNAVAMQRLGWDARPFAADIGRIAELDPPRDLDALCGELEERLSLNVLHRWPFGPPRIRRVAYVSGSGLLAFDEALRERVDAFITGEPRYSAFARFRELGVHGLFLGHYATERLGLWALAERMKALGLSTRFLQDDIPL